MSPARVAPALAAVLAAACVAACAERPGGATPGRDGDPAAPAAAASAADAASRAGSGRSAGKPVAPFALAYEVVGTPAVGQALEIRVTVRPGVPMSDLRLEAADEASLQVDAASAEQSAPSATPASPAAWTVGVVPLEQGVLRLRLTASGIIDGVRQARSIAVPIRVGTAGKSAPQSAAAPAGAPAPKTAEPPDDGLIHLHSN